MEVKILEDYNLEMCVNRRKTDQEGRDQFSISMVAKLAIFVAGSDIVVP